MLQAILRLRAVCEHGAVRGFEADERELKALMQQKEALEAHFSDLRLKAQRTAQPLALSRRTTHRSSPVDERVVAQPQHGRDAVLDAGRAQEPIRVPDAHQPLPVGQ